MKIRYFVTLLITGIAIFSQVGLAADFKITNITAKHFDRSLKNCVANKFFRVHVNITFEYEGDPQVIDGGKIYLPGAVYPIHDINNPDKPNFKNGKFSAGICNDYPEGVFHKQIKVEDKNGVLVASRNVEIHVAYQPEGFTWGDFVQGSNKECAVFTTKCGTGEGMFSCANLDGGVFYVFGSPKRDLAIRTKPVVREINSSNIHRSGETSVVKVGMRGSIFDDDYRNFVRISDRYGNFSFEGRVVW